MNGTGVAAFGPALPNPGPTWHVKAAGDFNGDGKADILWQNDNGQPAVWLMDGTDVATFGAGLGPIPARPGTSRMLAISTATARPTFSGRTTAARPAVWLMDGTDVTAAGRRPQSRADLAVEGCWRLQRRRQGRHPLAERQRAAGDLADGRHRPSRRGPALPNPGPTWHVEGCWRIQRRRQGRHPLAERQRPAAIWLMDGTNVTAFGAGAAQSRPDLARRRRLPTSTATARPTSSGRTTTATPAVWLMDGTDVATFGGALPNPGSDWHIIA